MRNIGEVLSSTNDKEQINHLLDLSEKILDKEVPMKDTDIATDENWEKEHREE